MIETVTEIEALVSCIDPFCAKGYRQAPITCELIITSRQYGDVDGCSVNGNAHLVESSTESLRYVDLKDEYCPHCGSPRILSRQVRPIYEPLAQRLIAARAAADKNSGVPAAMNTQQLAEHLEAAEKLNKKAAQAGPRTTA